MTLDKYVRCIRCDKGHLEIPEEVEHLNKDGVMVFGVRSMDYTYIKDMYQGVYGVLCKTHSRDEISHTKEKDLYLA
jgi:hypothetical protein